MTLFFMLSEYLKSLIEIKPYATERTIIDFNQNINNFGLQKSIDSHMKDLIKKDKIYHEVIDHYHKESAQLGKELISDYFLINSILFYKFFENQYLAESIEMPIVEKSTFDKVMNDFPEYNKDVPKGIKIFDKIICENPLYYTYIRQSLSYIKDYEEYVGLFGRSYTFTYMLLSEQSQLNNKRLIQRN